MEDAPLNIVHCLRAPVGGLFRHVCDLATEQAARGHRVGVIADAGSGGQAARERLTELARHCRLGVERLSMGRLPGPADALTAWRVARFARDWRADILHGHGAKGGAYARIAGSRLGGAERPLRVYTPHGGSLHYGRRSPDGLLYLGLERALLRGTDLIIFESDYGRRQFEAKVGGPGNLARVIHNGLRPEEFTPISPEADAADFVFLGELRWLKGVDVLLHALARLSGEPDLVIAGEGADRTRLEKLASGLGLDARVHFAGRQPTRPALARGRCLVVPSRAESLPYIVLEGIAAELPVVATNAGGIAEIFADRSTRLVPPDDAEALADAMAAIRARPEDSRREAAELAGSVAARFSVGNMADKTLAAYRETLNGGQLKAS